MVIEESSNEEKDTELIIHRSKIREDANIINRTSFYGSKSFWGSVGTPLLAGFLFLLFARQKDKSKGKAIMKREKVAKDSAFKELLSVAKSMIHSGTDSEFYSQIESTLRKAFEIEMDFDEDRLLSKTDIHEFIEKTNKIGFNDSVNSIFSICEQSKYGFASTNTSREETLDRLKGIVGELNLVKW